MRLSILLFGAAFCLQAQNPGLPVRTSPADYQAHAAAGAVTVAAEFTGHSVPTEAGPLTTEDYVAVETALFGAAGARLTLSVDDFSLRINGKKQPSPSEPYGVVLSSLKDPEWEPPTPPEKKSKGGMSSGGGGQKDSNDPPAPVKIPIEVQRAMAQRTQKASLPIGDRPLPQAGVLFFAYRGKTQNIKSMELIYAGPAGKATVTLK